ncbi:hypothetical protein Taro_009067, partial [Colocasia esculenta]|nr:hypothetical protein [Colocasia esculenta]
MVAFLFPVGRLLHGWQSRPIRVEIGRLGTESAYGDPIWGVGATTYPRCKVGSGWIEQNPSDSTRSISIPFDVTRFPQLTLTTSDPLHLPYLYKHHLSKCYICSFIYLRYYMQGLMDRRFGPNRVLPDS